MEIILVFLLGISIGSFLNVCIYRIPEEKSLLFPSSQCGACGKDLSILDLIPVLNYFYLRGKCRWCGASFSWQYPLVEFITGLLFVMIWLKYGLSWQVLTGWILVSILICVAVIDFYHLIIPNEIILTGLVLGLPLIMLQSWESLRLGLLSFFAAGLLFLAIAIISRGGMGGGDVKLAALMGLYLGPINIGVALFLAVLTGSIGGLLLMASGLKGRKDAIPFGPFFSFGWNYSRILGKCDFYVVSQFMELKSNIYLKFFLTFSLNSQKIPNFLLIFSK
jgi:leader peptidase (prepilin peptidase)/N-methyltransferase